MQVSSYSRKQTSSSDKPETPAHHPASLIYSNSMAPPRALTFQSGVFDLYRAAMSPLPPTQTTQEQSLILPPKGQNLFPSHSRVRSQFCLARKGEGWIAFWRT